MILDILIIVLLALALSTLVITAMDVYYKRKEQKERHLDNRVKRSIDFVRSRYLIRHAEKLKKAAALQGLDNNTKADALDVLRSYEELGEKLGDDFLEEITEKVVDEVWHKKDYGRCPGIAQSITKLATRVVHYIAYVSLVVKTIFADRYQPKLALGGDGEDGNNIRN